MRLQKLSIKKKNVKIIRRARGKKNKNRDGGTYISFGFFCCFFFRTRQIKLFYWLFLKEFSNHKHRGFYFLKLNIVLALMFAKNHEILRTQINHRSLLVILHGDEKKNPFSSCRRTMISEWARESGRKRNKALI